MTTLSGFDFDPDVMAPVGFRLRRANPTISGFTPAVDAFARERLTELEEELSRSIVPAGEDGEAKLLAWIKRPLTPRRAEARQPRWADDSLMGTLKAQQEADGERTFREVIDQDRQLSRMRYQLDQGLQETGSELDINTRTVLASSAVKDLLVLRGVRQRELASRDGLLNFVFNDAAGAHQVVGYLQVSAARDHIEDKGLDVDKISDDDSPAVEALQAAKLILSEESLGPRVTQIATAFIGDEKYLKLIKGSGTDPAKLPADIRVRLVQYIKHSSVKITTTNAPFLVPMYLAKAASSTTLSSGTSSDDPFAVDFFVEDSASLQVSTAAVKCAAQLFYVMVLGEELGVFDAVRYFTHRYLFREGFAVEDPQLRRDLENYVFSEQFPGVDHEFGEDRIMRCTRDGERRAFYRQVFDHGNDPVPGDGLPNADFARLWKILMLESARYLERAQSSPNPDPYVSRQNVMQAVEDLQYNLSVTCVGMATVMTPLMYAELDFVVNRILGHPEVRKHLVPSGGSWWKVVEKLQAGQGRRARASVLHNKARIGYALIRDIAKYTPSQFEQDGPFSQFISNVDAFITTQSILQEEAGSGADDTEEAPYGDDGYGSGNGSGTGNGGGFGQGYGRQEGGYGSGSLPGMPDLSKLPGMPSIPGVSAPWPGSGKGSGGANGAGRPNDSATAPAPASGGSGDEWDF